MSNLLTAVSRKLIFSAFALLLTTNIFASHIVGADLYYTHVSGNTYKISLAIYGNCGAASAAAFSTLQVATPQICIYNGNTYDTTVILSIDTPACGVEITPLCPGDTSQCTDMTSTIPGVKKFIYSNTITLPSTSAVWRFIYSGFNGSTAAAISCGDTGTAVPAISGRAAAITNLNSAASTIIQLIDTLNNVTYSNSSPDLTVTQQTFFCLNVSNYYNPTAVDPDGDSLLINLVSAVNGAGSPTCDSGGAAVPYEGTAWPGTPISATTPLQCDSAAFAINNITGEMVFIPNALQRGVVVYNIEERRFGTTLVGTSQREMTVEVLVCSAGSFPCLGGPALSIPTPANQAHMVSIYPNPAYDELTIKMDEGAYSSFYICNSLGQVLKQQKLSATQTDVNISSLPAGVYYINFAGDNGTDVQKFVKW